ncbi:MAG: hypothetical protein WBZ01_12175 [Terriglobales bacterium]|jgi:hypothetical protein
MKMKPAITITTTILVSVMAAGLASAQSPRIIQNTRETMNAVSNHATAASNEALGTQPKAPAPHPAAVTPAKSSSAQPAAKPAVTKRRNGSRGIAVLVSAPTTTAAAPQDYSPAAADVANIGAAGSAEGESGASDQQVVPDSKYNANGRRDPFISPVVSHAGGSGCSTGKKCLEIGTINLRGVVHSEAGFIAVVSNSLNKAYFLRENDPVFNGYVVKITGDSIVFQETLQDRLGKTFTREVVKKITTPAV